MPIVLFRVDERLIHGQVVVGWGGPLHIERLIVVDDDIASSSWEQELYTLGVPGGMEADFVSVEEGRAGLEDWAAGPRRTAVLVRDVATLRRMAEGGLLRGLRVNLGGIHHSAGRKRVLPYLFLGDDEVRTLEAIEDEGVLLAAQDLPGSRSVPLVQLIGA